LIGPLGHSNRPTRNLPNNRRLQRSVNLFKSLLRTSKVLAMAPPGLGLLKNEAVQKNSPFRTGPLKAITDVEEVTFDWVDWYHNHRLHGLLGRISSEEYEEDYYAETIGPSTDEAAHKTAA
jgi:transposase InsO family protein